MSAGRRWAGWRWGATALVMTAALSCSGSGSDDAMEEIPLLPGGYRVAIDEEGAGPGRFETAETPEGIRITTGPTGIAWRPADTVTAGDFRAEASFTLVGAPVGYREGYGVFAGGRDLDGLRPSYIYLLIRGNGDYLVKRRVGEATETLLDWTPHNAVQRVSSDGDDPANQVGIEVREGETRFLVNGTVVFRMPVDEAAPYGWAGLRVNHRLHVLLGQWTLGPPQDAP